MCQENSGDNEITCLIEAARQGDALAESQLCDKVFLELHRIAKHLVPRDQGSVHATLLVHEMWLKLFSRNGLKKTENRRYFFTVAADQMARFLLTTIARRKRRRRVAILNANHLSKSLIKLSTTSRQRVRLTLRI